MKAAALDLGIPVTERVDDVIAAGVDLAVVVAFGRLVKRHVLEAVPMVNVHFSLLPRWRGAAPVERAVLAGDDVTGVCVMGLEEGLDTGPVYGRVEVPIGPEETAAELRARLVEAGTGLLVRLLAEGLPEPEPQSGEPTYAAKVEPGELCLDWSRPAAELHRVVRVGGAWTTFGGARLKVHRALVDPGRADLPPGVLDGTAVGTGDGVLRLVEVQAEGRPARPAEEWARGARPAPGTCLGG